MFASLPHGVTAVEHLGRPQAHQIGGFDVHMRARKLGNCTPWF